MKPKGVPSIRWETIKLQKELIDAIDDFISRTGKDGIRRFDSRADFVREACLRYFAKNVGEREILVTRK